jgi:4-hydroxy-3-methylbut-2-enyl diphosphate reductase
VIVVRADSLGFCMGVRRAVALALDQARAHAPVYTMGPLIHNPRVRADLREQGISEAPEEPAPLHGAVVVVRAHGIPPSLERRLRERGAVLADATCPKVKASQLAAQSLAHAGCAVFLAGEKTHGELIGLLGYAPEAFSAANADEARVAAAALYARDPHARTALLAQTTLSPAEYQDIARAISGFFPGLAVIDTICKATRDRQEALRRLCGQVQAVVVAGGRDSANTRRLAAIAREQATPAWLIESAAELPAELAAYSRVGLSAGASTPEQLIAEIQAALENGSYAR